MLTAFGSPGVPSAGAAGLGGAAGAGGGAGASSRLISKACDWPAFSVSSFSKVTYFGFSKRTRYVPGLTFGNRATPPSSVVASRETGPSIVTFTSPNPAPARDVTWSVIARAVREALLAAAALGGAFGAAFGAGLSGAGCVAGGVWAAGFWAGGVCAA